MRTLYGKYLSLLNKLSDIPLLMLRLILAYGFYEPAIMKWKDINAIGQWFMDLGIPFPYLNAYMAAITEITGVVLLILGLGTRFITIPLMVTMLVAIKTVHLANGFQASDNGFEIPLYYLLMLFTLLVYGAGKISLDNVIRKRLKI